MSANPKWDAVRTRDRAADGTFVYAVRTTGVYCRPSCPSRLPRLENVAFHASAEEAAAAGYRPCKRCRPDRRTADTHAELVARLCRKLAESQPTPSLKELAEDAGLSLFHLHRIFVAETGVTPKQYAMAHRTARVRDGLARGRSVTDALYEAGYGAQSRFYAVSTQALGMTPTRYRNGGDRTRIRFAIGECSLGSILVAATEIGIAAIFLGDDPDALLRDLESRFRRADLVGGDPAFEQLVARVVAHVEEPRVGLDLPLDVQGTAFQQRVWHALRRIPIGATASYTDIAHAIGAPRSVRAVAQACGANPVAVAIPCHRVVCKDGDVSGYRWGVERKRALLGRERLRDADR